MDPSLFRDVQVGWAVLYFGIVFGIPLLTMLFYRTPHDEDEYVDEHQGLGEIEDDWGLRGVS